MAESSRNYQNGKIYCIRNWVDDDIYIGSSCQPLSKRMEVHRSYGRNNKGNSRLYQKMKDLDIDCFYIELEEFPCDNVEQLRKREGELIREQRPKLNMRIECRTQEEHKQYNQKYREENKEYLKEYDKQRNKARTEYKHEYNKQYYNDNMDKILAKGKQYRENNKEKINQREQKYRENNKETIKERDRLYRENNKEKISKNKLEKYDCECGGHYSHCQKTRHLRSKKHQDFIENK